ncbi:hypothetical protein V7S43_007883 [Phytophthora oleae]|uniref:Uncharacterized protein n=1 Tax=Phytophthora oleae TaxID=2107226 RepID=A0ABD3FKH1_9STRA
MPSRRKRPTPSSAKQTCCSFFLAKKNNLWLQSRSDDVKKLDVGETTAAIEELTHEEKELDPTETLRDLFGDITTKGTIYVLVVVPSGFDLIIGETTSGTLDRNELEYYQQRGQVIRSNCHSYCEEILQQVTSHYKT